jgi:Ser/Thr protein kinase RdoA (MazF antagonist)
LKRTEPDFLNLVKHFNFEGDFIRAEPYGYGHINDTYTVFFKQADGKFRKYILQWINHFVFKHPVGLMKNIEAITDHLRRKVISAGGNPDRETLTLVPTRTGKTYHKTKDGLYWRSYTFIEDALTYQTPASMRHVYNAARAFGNFQKMLDDFPVDRLFDTIPDFHNTPKRYQTFIRAVEMDEHNRASGVRDEIEFVMRRADEMHVVVDLIEQGRLPERVTHNDTKYNNVMIDDLTGESLCVIDLDTVMGGSALYDFGDAIRSISNTAAEDERDLSQVRFSLETFQYYARGYLDATINALTPDEIDHLPFSARLMTLECGIRFLTDYLEGDVYFRTHRENHNLDRCRTQFKLVQEMEENYQEMMQTIEKSGVR